MLPATLKPRSDLLVATGTANTANPAGIKLVFGPLSRNITRTELNQGPRLTLMTMNNNFVEIITIPKFLCINFLVEAHLGPG